MKRVVQEITEVYKYNSFAEFEEHYAQMLKEGYEPNCDTCKPNYYYNHDMDSYISQYNKRTTNY